MTPTIKEALFTAVHKADLESGMKLTLEDAVVLGAKLMAERCAEKCSTQLDYELIRQLAKELDAQ